MRADTKELEEGNGILGVGSLMRMIKDKKNEREREEIEVMHIATVECHSFRCWCNAYCLRSDPNCHWFEVLYLIARENLMNKHLVPKTVPGIYSTSLITVENNDPTTVYHPLKKSINQNQLSVDSLTAYNYRSRANSNIIERRFSNVETPVFTPEQICK